MKKPHMHVSGLPGLLMLSWAGFDLRRPSFSTVLHSGTRPCVRKQDPVVLSGALKGVSMCGKKRKPEQELATAVVTQQPTAELPAAATSFCLLNKACGRWGVYSYTGYFVLVCESENCNIL